jgi:hypothetical protein
MMWTGVLSDERNETRAVTERRRKQGGRLRPDPGELSERKAAIVTNVRRKGAALLSHRSPPPFVTRSVRSLHVPVSLLVRSRRISPLSLVTSPHHFGSVPWDERGERRQKEDRTEWDETERGRSRHSSSVVGLVHYVHHPTPSSERSDRREWIIGCGPRVREMKGMWSERNVNETRLSSLSLASPRIPVL